MSGQDLSSPAGTDERSTPAKKRCIVYIDGFNLYYGILQNRPELKWLNIQSYFESLRLDEEVVQIKYFSAIIDPDAKVSERRDRQKRYLKTFRASAKLLLILGRYRLRTVRCRARCKQEYQTPEEKKTDVNIAIHMVEDALENRADTLVLVSGDSDIEPAVEWIRKQRPSLKLTVYIPVLPAEAGQRRNDFYRSIHVTCRDLPVQELAQHQLPAQVHLPDGQMVERPREWIATKPNS